MSEFLLGFLRGEKKQRQMLQLKFGSFLAAVALVWVTEGACLSSFFCSSLPFPPSLTWIGSISHSIPVSFSVLLLLTWEGMSSLQELPSFYAQLVINFFPPSFLLPFFAIIFSDTVHSGHSLCSPWFIIPVFIAKHHSGCCYCPYSISQKWALVYNFPLLS